MKHEQSSPLAGKTVKIKKDAHELGGNEYQVEDWWDIVAGDSWMTQVGNPACMQYAVRSALGDRLPIDDEVLYGKIGGSGNLVHITEIED